MATQLSFDDIAGKPVSDQPINEDSGELAVVSSSSMDMNSFSTNPQFSTADVSIPRLRVMQGMSQEVQDGAAVVGDLLVTGYEPAKELTIIPMRMARRYELMDEDFNRLCVANDGENGEGDPGGECKVCPMNQWEGEKGSRIAPKCTFMYTYVMYIAEYGTLAMVDFRRTSIGVGKQLNTFVMQRGMGRFAVKVKTVKQTCKKGTWNLMSLTPTTVRDDVLAAANGAI